MWATKGEAARNGKRSPIWPSVKPTRRDKSKFKPIIIGVNAGKDTLRARLALAEPGPGYMHFPADRDLGWYEQLTAERLIVKVASGRRYTVWDQPKGKANEATDCRIQAMAALAGMQHLGLRLNERVEDAAASPQVVAALADQDRSDARSRAASQKWVAPQRDWINRRR